VCASSARTDLCGGQRVTAVPTATDLGFCHAEKAEPRSAPACGFNPSFAAVTFEGQEAADQQKHNRHRRENAGGVNGCNRDRGEPGRKQYS